MSAPAIGRGESGRAPGDARRARLANALTLGVGALGALALKSFYSQAGAAELEFALAPTVALAEAFSGVAFEPETGVGYWSRERAYLIAPACAGLNFTIAAFAALVLAFVGSAATLRARVAGLAAAAAIAFAATPPVNAARIALDLAQRSASLPAWLSPRELHRVEGIVLYLGAVLALHALASRALGARGSRASAVRVPVTAYLAVTLVVPWLGGAGAQPAFWRHAAAVALVAGALAVAWLAVAHATRRGYSPRRRA